jgi:hypothetical protein
LANENEEMADECGETVEFASAGRLLERSIGSRVDTNASSIFLRWNRPCVSMMFDKSKSVVNRSFWIYASSKNEKFFSESNCPKIPADDEEEEPEKEKVEDDCDDDEDDDDDADDDADDDFADGDANSD